MTPPMSRDSGSASCVGDTSRSQSPPGRRHPDPICKRQMRTMPVEHSKFIHPYISNLQAFFDFALGCGIPSCIVCRAIEDNDPSDDDISLDDCVSQVLTVWWLSSNKPAIWKSDKALFSCICLEFIPVFFETPHSGSQIASSQQSNWPTTWY